LYKAEITIPIAFKVAAELADSSDDIGGATRRAVRDAISDGKIMERCAKDIVQLLMREENEQLDFEADVLTLWDDKTGDVKSGVSYGNSSYDTQEDTYSPEEGYGSIIEDTF
jgi:CRISPR-associated protein Cas1